MNRNSKKLGIYIGIVSVIAIAATAFRTIALLADYDISTAYFNNPLLVTISGAIIVAAVLLSIVLAFTLECVSLKANFSSPLTYIPVGALAMTIVSVFIYLIRSADIGTTLFKGMVSVSIVLSIVTALLALVAIGHLFLTTLVTKSQTTLRAYFAIGSIAFLAAFASLMYFDESLALNAHTKIVDQMAMLFAAIFLLYEARISLGREMWRAYAAFGLVALAVTSYAAIPNLIVYFARGVAISLSLEISVFLLALSIFIFSRLILMTRLDEAGERGELVAMREYADKRQSGLELGEAETSDDDIQISINDLFGEELDTLPASDAEQGEASEETEE